MVSRDDDLDQLLQLHAHLLARPAGVYLDRYAQPCRHPGGLYSQSLGKVLTRMRALTETFPPGTRDPNTLNQSWPTVMAALETLLIAVDSHADDLKNIVAATVKPDKKALRTLGDQIDGIFSELAGRPVNRVKHNQERFECCYCYSPRFAVYGYFVAGIRF